MQEAQAAQAQTNEYRLDKNHTFAVSMYDDFEKYARVPEEYAEPEEKVYEARVSLWTQLSSRGLELAYDSDKTSTFSIHLTMEVS